MAERKIDLNKLPSNNLEAPNEPERREPEITGRVRTKRNTGVARDVRAISSTLFNDTILPAIKSVITEFFTNFLDMALWGEGSRPNRAHRPRRDYSQMYNRGRPSRPQRRYSGVDRTMQLDDIFFSRKSDAEATLAHLLGTIAEYGWVPVGDLHNLVGISSNYNHENYGWSDLGSARIKHTREGWLIDLPDPVYIR